MKIRLIHHCLLTLITPSIWFVDEAEHSFDVDCLIRILLREGEVLDVTEEIINFKLNDLIISIWIGNYPYYYGGIYKINSSLTSNERYMPYLQTSKLLREFVEIERKRKFKQILDRINEI